MIYTTVAGENAGQLWQALGGLLSQLCSVAMVEGSSLQAPAVSPELLLWHGCGDIFLNATPGILVFGEPMHRAGRIEVPQDCIVVASVEDDSAAGYAARRGLRLLDCGLSSKATLTFSSIGRESGVISLQRAITDLYGTPIEPLEFPLGFEPKPHYAVLAAAAVLLLCGMGERLCQSPALHNNLFVGKN